MDEKQRHGMVTQVGPTVAPHLEVTGGENLGETFKVKLKTSIGRERDNDIVIVDPKISRYHAQIAMQGGQWLLTDLGSSNHTYLNGLIVNEPAALRAGDRIGMGETEMTWQIPGSPSGQTVPSIPVAASWPRPTFPGLAATAAQTQPGWDRLPRMAWVAAGFILLLCLGATAALYLAWGRLPDDEPLSSPEAAAVAIEEGGANAPAEVAAAPTNLSLIYEDDFDDSSSGWDDAFDAYTTKQYGNNRYQIEINTSNLVAWGLANRDVADFEIEVETRPEGGEATNSYGLLFRFQDRENFYRFDVSGDGYYLVSKFFEGEWVTLVAWTASEYINQGAANILKVSAFGPKITVWANGQPLTTVTDDSLSHGNFGFFASTFGEQYVWVSYDNLKLWLPQGQEEAITLLPTATRPIAPLAPTLASTPTLPPATRTPTATPAPDVTEESEADEEATATPTRTPTVTPTSEPTATPVPLPEYVSRDQILGRGETEVTGRIIFPVFDPERGTYDIYMADAADGGNRELVQENASQPALSHDGSELTYRSWQPDKRGLFARPLSGGEAWQFNQFFESGRPQFSPIDQSLIYHSRVGGREPAIYRVINGVGEVMRREGFPIQGEAPKWTPNGDQFVYSSCLGGKCGVIVSNIDSTHPVLLADHPTDTNPEVSPDGSTVVFMSKRGGNWEIYKVGINGGEIIALTSNNDNDGLPTWSPDGSKIAFVSNRDGEWSIWDMDPDGNNKRRLFTLGGSIDGMVQHDIANSRGWVEENIDWAP